MSEILPKPVDDAAFVFGQIEGLLPKWKDIPEEFKHENTRWNRFVSRWFFRGVDAAELTEKPGIDKKMALRHVQACMRSWEPKHEHKTAGCAYLLSLWFDFTEKEERP